MDRPKRHRAAFRLAFQLATAAVALAPNAGAQAALSTPTRSGPRDVAPAVPLATRSAARAGVPFTAVDAAPKPDSSVTGGRHRRARHAAVGAGIGLLAGAATGIALGAYADSQGGGETMVPAFGILGILGAGAGLLIGGVVGALRP